MVDEGELIPESPSLSPVVLRRSSRLRLWWCVRVATEEGDRLINQYMPSLPRRRLTPRCGAVGAVGEEQTSGREPYKATPSAGGETGGGKGKGGERRK